MTEPHDPRRDKSIMTVRDSWLVGIVVVLVAFALGLWRHAHGADLATAIDAGFAASSSLPPAWRHSSWRVGAGPGAGRPVQPGRADHVPRGGERFRRPSAVTT